MVDNDLDEVPGLLTKHRAVLADQCQITTPAALAYADRRLIHRAMHRMRPRPSLEDIATWQDHARDIDAPVDRDPGWDQVSAFVVSFEQRGPVEARERRVAIEQAEHAPPAPRSVWPGWDCDPICGWMHHHLNAEFEVAPAPPVSVPPTNQPVQPGVEAEAEPAPRDRITVEPLMLVDGDGTAASLPAEGSVDVGPGSQLRVSVSGPAPETIISLAIRVRRGGGPGWTPHQPIQTRPGKPVDIDLVGLPAGRHSSVLAAWTDGGSAEPSVVELPTFTVARRDD